MSSSAGNPKTSVVTGYLAPGSGSSGAPLLRPFYSPPPPAYTPPSRYETFLTFFQSRRCYIALGYSMLLCLLVLVILSFVLGARMPEFGVSSACVTGFNLSAQQQQLSASFDLNLTVHSPNLAMRIYYEQFTASVLYSSYILSQNLLAPFYQGTGETTVLRVQFAAIGEHVNSDVARRIESDRGRGAVGFNVRVVSWFRFRSWAKTSSWSTLSVQCDDILIGFGNATTSTGYLIGSAPKKCEVDHGYRFMNASPKSYTVSG